MSKAAIVVGTDGSDSAGRAVLKAGDLAGALGAPLHVMMCSESPANVAMSAAGLAHGAMVSFDEDPREYALRVVDRARDQLVGRDIEMVTHVREGEPAEALISLAEELDAQMIVVGNRGMKGAARMLGSVPNRVSHRATCAVLIVPTGEPATDPSSPKTG